jgi:uncharacterized membrane protein
MDYLLLIFTLDRNILSKVKQSIHSYNNSNWLHLLFLVFWLVIGITLRFTNLDAKPASSIEIATIGFSLGHGFSQIPLDRVIDISTLLFPLKFDAAVSYADVVNRLMKESTHPPVYFWLTHWWTKLFVSNGELVSLTVERSLSAMFGGLAIPTIFSLSWVAFRSRLIAHLAAALMAVSPYGIYLAQEARHYTLTILWIIGSLICLMVASRCINSRTRLPILVGCLWIVINSFGMATHYFFALALGAEALVIVRLCFWDFNRDKALFSFGYWWHIVAVGLGTLVSCLVWLSVARGVSSNELTDWIQTSYDLDVIWQPILRLIAWLITMVMLLPIESTPLAVTVISALVVLLVLMWLIPALIRGWKSSLDSKISLPLKVLIGYWLGSIIIFLLVIYGLGKDVSLAARYHFVYFPVVVVLIAVALGNLWQSQTQGFIRNKHHWFYAQGKKVTVIVLLMGFIGSLTVISNYGFQKSRHSDALANHILATSKVSSIVATTYETSSQLRELIALALSFERVNSQTNSLSHKPKFPQFLLVQQADTDLVTLSKILTSQPKPLDLWGVNLKIDSENLDQLNCIEDSEAELSNSGYKNRLYHCR